MKFLSALLLALSSLGPLAAQSPAPLPALGRTAPAFTLPSQEGKQISLKSFRGHWVVLYFYPRDMTSGCTIEAHNFQRDLPKFALHRAVVLGLSVDSPSSHSQFCAKESLTFRLLADQSRAVTRAYGSLAERNGVSMAQRNTFLIDPKGNLTQLWTQVNPASVSSDVLAALDRLDPSHAHD